MKKILLSALMLMGLVANAQIMVNESFETSSYATNGFAISGGYSGTAGTYTITPNSCDGNIAIGTNLYGATTSATGTLLYTKPSSVVANGEEITVSFNYITMPYSSTSSIGGNIVISYSTDNGTSYITLLTHPLSTTSESCTPISVTIPATAGVTGNFRLRVQGISTSANNDFYIFFDKFTIKQSVTATPDCTSLVSSLVGATNVSVRPTISWNAAPQAEKYLLQLGTTAGASDILSTTVYGTSFTPSSTEVLPENTVIYSKITSINDIGESTGCDVQSFTTGANIAAPYCGPVISTVPLQMAPIKSVELNGVINESDTSATTVGTYDAYQYFNTPFVVKSNVTSIPITVKGVGIANNGWGISVFIDWNEDGDFDDEGEAYFNTTTTIKRTTTVSSGVATLTGNLAVPTGTNFGNKRMRVKYNFTGTGIHNALATPCSDVGNGQVEDYTISYEEFLAAADVTKSNVSLYPNPFVDVLKISDVKGIKSISVSDATGRTVSKLAPSTEINLSKLTSGVYIVTLLMEDGSVKSHKVIKK